MDQRSLKEVGLENVRAHASAHSFFSPRAPPSRLCNYVHVDFFSSLSRLCNYVHVDFTFLCIILFFISFFSVQGSKVMVIGATAAQILHMVNTEAQEDDASGVCM